MMLGLLRKRNPYEHNARAVYAAALKKVREPSFYTAYGVPDTFDGRFDLLLLHVFLVINRMVDEQGVGAEFNQALFDVTFADMDQTLREMGIGDMGVPKHMRRMMKAFNGRMHVYQDAFKNGFLRTALIKNLYGTCSVTPFKQAEMMETYLRATALALKGRPMHDILDARNIFIRS
jgi:cytochrome b pre-mRNA-processing protein 3